MHLNNRIALLKKLKNRIAQSESELLAALKEDMNKPELESFSSEVVPTISEIDFALKKLKGWMKPKKVSTPKAFFPAKSYIVSEPKGRVLVIGAWNYPFQLSLIPAVGAIAAGNRVVIKPSEVASATSSYIKKLCSGFNELLDVVEGGVDETTKLLEQSFDHIFYTGGAQVAKIIMTKAAQKLTPVTLELGGKSPAIVMDSIEHSAKRIVWGKFFNSGQTCVAPDYVLVKKEHYGLLIDRMKFYLEQFYSKNPLESDDLASIINEKHFKRLQLLLGQCDVIYGGDCNEDHRKISPTLVKECEAVMNDEIFGPILPIIPFDNIENAISRIKEGEKPLALYLFSDNKKYQKLIVDSISCGGICINDTLLHLSNPHLPFGGIGFSGMGNYHGKFSFDTFSHYKAVMKRPLWLDIPMRYAPYTFSKLKLMRQALRFRLF